MIQEIGRVRERKNLRERGGRNESSLDKGNLAVGFESMLGARKHGSEVGATDLGAEAPTSEPCFLAPRYRPRQRYLG